MSLKAIKKIKKKNRCVIYHQVHNSFIPSLGVIQKREESKEKRKKIRKF